MFLIKEFQTFLGTALPIMVQVGVIYLILRFTFAVSNVLVRLATLNRPPPETEDDDETVSDPDAAQPVAALGEGSEEEEEKPSGDAAEALPETTTED
ncbi:MAG: hypothetical protein V3V56_09925 [bacterium]